MKLYAVYDAAAQAFMSPFTMRSHGEAMRSFSHACEDEKSAFYRSLVDYSLWHIGEYNEQTAAIEPVTPPVCIVKAEAFSRRNDA